LKELGEEENVERFVEEANFSGEDIEYARDDKNDISLLTIQNE
jgi:hypothetical protein